MDALSSECSSGCESGWTLYFDHSSSEDAAATRVKDGGDLKKPEFGKKGFDEEDEEEEEDLSMVSDASSGPPIHYEAADTPDEALRPACTNTKKRRTIKLGRGEDYQSLLDDTASSPAIVTTESSWLEPEGWSRDPKGKKRKEKLCMSRRATSR